VFSTKRGNPNHSSAGRYALKSRINGLEAVTASWALYLEPAGDNATRLIERWRADWNPSFKNWIFMRLFMEPGAFLMQRKMLLGIKQRSEALI
jgi:hypothetical protein